MRVPFSLAALLVFTLSACSSSAALTSTVPSEKTQHVLIENPTVAASPSLTPLTLSTGTATPTPTTLPSPTSTPSPTPVPSPTSTPIGGGSGILLVETCPTWYDCEPWQLSLTDGQLVQYKEPYLKLEVVNLDSFKFRMVLSNPSTGEATTVLQCPDDIASCYQTLISGSLQDDQLYLAQAYQRALYDGNRATDLYRLETRSLELNLLDHFAGDLRYFFPFSTGSQGLMGLLGNTFHGELLLYNLNTLKRSTLIARRGQFLSYGANLDEQIIWYRIADYCETELLATDGKRIAQIKNSDGIIGWIDDENFLLFTASNNPPICSRTGIAAANRYGLTGQWITSSPTNWAMLSPDAERIFYSSGCNNLGCNKLEVANLDGSDPHTIIESSQRMTGYPGTSLLSPDRTKLVFIVGMQIWLVDSDGSDPQILLESNQDWRITGWLNK